VHGISTTRALYLGTWRAHLEERWAARKLLSVSAEEVASWQQELLAGRVGRKTVLNSVQLLGSLFKHARRFQWIPSNPCEDVRKPKYKVKVRAFTAVEVAAIANAADESTALLVRTAASTGMRFGELAGLQWICLDLEKGVIAVSRQFTHGAWSELKTANSRRRVPLAKELLHRLKLHRLRTPGELVFPGHTDAEGKVHPIDYHNWRVRVWGPLLRKTGPDDAHPDRVAVVGRFHMLRHFFVTALIQSGVNAKVAQTLAGHHSASFTLDQYANAVPEQLEEAGERVAMVLLQASGSKTVAAVKTADSATAQVIEIVGAPGEIRTPDLLVRSQALYPTELRAHRLERARILPHRVAEPSRAASGGRDIHICRQASEFERLFSLSN
jgi:integrase